MLLLAPVSRLQYIRGSCSSGGRILVLGNHMFADHLTMALNFYWFLLFSLEICTNVRRLLKGILRDGLSISQSQTCLW